MNSVLRTLLSFLLLPPSPLLGHANLLHGKAVTVSEQLTLPFVTGSESPRQVESGNHPVVVKSPLPLDLGVLGQKDEDCTLARVERARKNGAVDFYPARVMARLQQAEAHEPNLHFKSDYRQAWITLSLAVKGVPEPFTAASYAIYGLHQDNVWPAIVAERKAKLGDEYPLWFDAAGNLRPDAPKFPPSSALPTPITEPAIPPKPQAGSVPRKEIV